MKKKKENKFSYAKSHLLKDDEVGKPSGPMGFEQLDSGAEYQNCGAYAYESTVPL